MTQNSEKEKVLVRIINEQSAHGDTSSTELITTGFLEKPANSAFRLRYDEILGEDVRNTTSRVILTDDGDGSITVERDGPFTMKMIFATGGSHRCLYQTPYGELWLHVRTAQAQTDYLPDRLRVFLDFEVFAEGSSINKTKMTYFIKPRKVKRGEKDGKTI